MPYNSNHVSTLFGVTRETVRAWAEEFTRHLSPTANPGKGRHRLFTEDDMRIFSLIDEYKRQGRLFEDIHVALENGQRGHAPAMPPEEVQILVVSEHERRLSLEVDYLQRALAKVQQELEDTRAALEKAREYERDAIRLQAALDSAKQYGDQHTKDLAEQLEGAQKQISALLQRQSVLEREVGEAYVKGVMEALERRGDLPKRDG